jgi:hypothetical protein
LSTWVDEIPRRHNQLEMAWPDERTQRDLDIVTPLGLPGAPLPPSVRRHDDEIVRNHTGEPVLLGGSHSGNHSAMSGLILRRQRGAVLARFIGRGKCQIWRERCRSDRRHAVANAVVLRGGGGGRRRLWAYYMAPPPSLPPKARSPGLWGTCAGSLGRSCARPAWVRWARRRVERAPS